MPMAALYIPDSSGVLSPSLNLALPVGNVWSPIQTGLLHNSADLQMTFRELHESFEEVVVLHCFNVINQERTQTYIARTLTQNQLVSVVSKSFQSKDMYKDSNIHMYMQIHVYTCVYVQYIHVYMYKCNEYIHTRIYQFIYKYQHLWHTSSYSKIKYFLILYTHNIVI